MRSGLIGAIHFKLTRMSTTSNFCWSGGCRVPKKKQKNTRSRIELNPTNILIIKVPSIVDNKIISITRKRQASSL